MVKPAYLRLVMPLVLCLEACSPVPRTFRLVPGDHGPVLIPPGVRDAGVSRATLRVQRGRKTPVCTASPAGLRLTGKSIVVTREAMVAATSEELARWVAELEENGCVSPSEAATLSETLVNQLPLSIAQRRKLRGELSAVQGWVDLNANTSLRVVTPVFRPGAPDAKAIATSTVSPGAAGGIEVEIRANLDLVGYEVAWYRVQTREDGPGLRLAPRGAEVHIAGTVEKVAAPKVNQLYLDPAARWFRYFVMTRASRNDYNIVVLSGSSRSELETRSEAFRRDAVRYLQTAPKGSFAAMSSEIGINLYVHVEVNGVPRDVAVGSTVRQAIDEAAGTVGTAEQAARLSVLKPHRRGMATVDALNGRNELLNLPIEGGEQISCSPKRQATPDALKR